MSDTDKEAPLNDWRCAGCGKVSPNRVRSCDCPTNCLFRDLQEPHPYRRHEGTTKIDIDPLETLTKERDALQARVAELEGALVSIVSYEKITSPTATDFGRAWDLQHAYARLKTIARQALKESNDE